MPEQKRQVKRITLAAKLATRTPTMNEGSLLTNCYEEPSPKGERAVKRPGFNFQAVVGSACQGQGAIEWMGKTLIIGCDTLWDLKYQFMRAVVGQGQLGGSAPVNDPVTGLPISGSGGSGKMTGTFQPKPTVTHRYMCSLNTGDAIDSISPTGVQSAVTTVAGASGLLAGASGVNTFFLATTTGWTIYSKAWAVVASGPTSTFGAGARMAGYINGYYVVGSATTLYIISEAGVLGTSAAVTPDGINAMTVDTNNIWVVGDTGAPNYIPTIQKYTPALGFVSSVTLSAAAYMPTIASDGTYLYTSGDPTGTAVNGVWKLLQDGTPVTHTTNFTNPGAALLTMDGLLYSTDNFGSEVYIYNTSDLSTAHHTIIPAPAIRSSFADMYSTLP